MKEAVRVASLYVVIYHARLQPRPKGTFPVRVIVVLTRPDHAPRVCQVFRKQDVPDHVQGRLEF